MTSPIIPLLSKEGERGGGNYICLLPCELCAFEILSRRIPSKEDFIPICLHDIGMYIGALSTLCLIFYPAKYK